MSGEQGFAGQRVPGLARRLDQHRLAAERRKYMPVGRISRYRDRDPVTGFEHGKEAQDKGTRGTRGDDDSLSIHSKAVRIVVVAGDAFTERGYAERRGVIDPQRVERGVSGQ